MMHFVFSRENQELIKERDDYKRKYTLEQG